MRSEPANGRHGLRQGLGRLLLQVLCGALVWAASPGLGGQGWLAAVALVPFFLSVYGTRGWRAAVWGAVGGTLYIVPDRWSTIATAIGAMGVSKPLELTYVVAFFALVILPFPIFAWLWQHPQVRDRSPVAPWLGGFGFAALILHSPSVFPFTPAVMLTAHPLLIQLAAVGGEPLLLGLLLTVNIGLAQLIAQHRWQWGAGIAVLAPLFATLGYGAISLSNWQGTAQRSMSVMALQGQWPPRSSDALLLRDRARTRPLSLVELTRAGLAETPGCDMVVWPESPRIDTAPDRTCARAATLSGELGLPILATCHDRNTEARNFVARMYTPAGTAGTHRKSRLVPMYETGWHVGASVPRPLSEAARLTPPDLPPLTPAICYEVNFRHDLRRGAAAGGEWIAHMANFAVFRHIKLHHWDLAMTRLRAVETRRSILRSVNSGVAGVVHPSGAWQSAAAPGESAARCLDVPVHTKLSLYTRYGDRLFWMLLLGFAMATGWPLGRRALSRRRQSG